MENYNPTDATPETLRQVLTAQDETIRHLRNLVSGMAGNQMADLRHTLTERLQQMEELEKRMWATLFPPGPQSESSAHRMTMTYFP